IYIPLFESILDGIDMLNYYTDKSKVLIVLTDGKADSNDNINNCIKNAKDNDIMLYTIGLGSNLDFSILGNISSETNGAFANASNSTELEKVYNNIGIATFKGKVSVSGEGEFIPPLLNDGNFSVRGELLTTIERKTIKSNFTFNIQVEQ
ncbi:von Willebrand factor, type A domain protein, partial [Candidatus Magnetomorum sp. HK-1]